MNDHSWFRLLVRLFGLYLLLAYAPELVMQFLRPLAFPEGYYTSMPTPQFIVFFVMPLVASVLPVVFGAYLFFRGNKLIRWCMRDIIGHCPTCGYDLRGNMQANCPECGCENPYRGKFAVSKPGGLSADASNTVSSG
jgi:hypothetical protein